MCTKRFITHSNYVHLDARFHVLIPREMLCASQPFPPLPIFAQFSWCKVRARVFIVKRWKLNSRKKCEIDHKLNFVSRAGARHSFSRTTLWYTATNQKKKHNILPSLHCQKHPQLAISVYPSNTPRTALARIVAHRYIRTIRATPRVACARRISHTQTTQRRRPNPMCMFLMLIVLNI